MIKPKMLPSAPIGHYGQNILFWDGVIPHLVPVSVALRTVSTYLSGWTIITTPDQEVATSHDDQVVTTY